MAVMPNRVMLDPSGNEHAELDSCAKLGCEPVDPDADCDCPEVLPLPTDKLTVPTDEAKSPYDPPPKHYAGKGGLDPWAVWDAFDLDRYTANAVKYLLRAGKKDIAPKLDDLKKARNYVNKLIEMEEGRGG